MVLRYLYLMIRYGLYRDIRVYDASKARIDVDDVPINFGTVPDVDAEV